jgi:phospholipid/cholesterol/gamma-HCH transport system ATP-binding protein
MQDNQSRQNCDFPVRIDKLTVVYNHRRVLNRISLDVYPGVINVIIGKSGSGKSTLLRHALGLQMPTGGVIELFGKRLDEMSDGEIRRSRLRTGVLFQSGALFSSMTVFENVAVVIRENTNLPEPIVAEMVRMKLSLVGLEDAAGKRPEQLSGGMRKRAALARAIATDPEILFCDEPSAGLDPVVASELDDLLIRLCENLHMTMLVVTHDIESIKKIAGRVAMLDAGKIVAEGPLETVLKNTDPRVHDFFNRVSHAEEKSERVMFMMGEGDVG